MDKQICLDEDRLTDWSYLMQVVEVIESKYTDFHGRFEVYISSNNCTIQGSRLNTSHDNPYYALFMDVYGTNKKHAVLLACKRFVKWYNNFYEEEKLNETVPF